MRAKRERDAAVKAARGPAHHRVLQAERGAEDGAVRPPERCARARADQGRRGSREQFFQANPDLDPRVQERLAKETVKVKGQDRAGGAGRAGHPADPGRPEAIADAEGRRTGTWTSAEQTRKRAIDDHNRIMTSSPHSSVRASASMSWRRRARSTRARPRPPRPSARWSTPRHQTDPGRAGPRRAVVAVGSKQAAIGLDQVLQNKDPRTLLVVRFKSDVDKHIGFGEVRRPAAQSCRRPARRAKASSVLTPFTLTTPDKQGIRC